MARKILIAFVFALLASGCRDESVHVYKVAKEKPPETAGPALTAAAGVPELRWKAPERWKQGPSSQMRLASYRVPGPDGKEADFSIVAFPGDAGGELANLNRWRGQVGLGALDEKSMEAEARDLKCAAGTARLVDFAGAPSASGRTRLLGAILKTGDRSWFFKLMGEDRTVSAAKDEFIGLLKELKRG